MISNALFTMNKDNRITQDAFYSYCLNGKVAIRLAVCTDWNLNLRETVRQTRASTAHAH